MGLFSRVGSTRLALFRSRFSVSLDSGEGDTERGPRLIIGVLEEIASISSKVFRFNMDLGTLWYHEEF